MASSNEENSDTNSENEASDDGMEYGNDIENQEELDTDHYPYKILSPQEVVQCMEDSVKSINTLLEIPPGAAQLLLNHFQWDEDRLLEKFYDADHDELFAEAHIINLAIPFEFAKIVEVSPGMEECQICYQVFSSVTMGSLNCFHRFCFFCWNDYLITKIMEDGAAQPIECPTVGCNLYLDNKTIMRLLLRDNVIEKYKHLIINNYVQTNRLLKWCPSPNCDRAIKVQYVDKKAINCICKNKMCFSCGENWHGPIACSLLNKWLKKCSQNSATSNLLASYTKYCPKCFVSIHKDGGCNHMVCINLACKEEFCWVCLGPWAPHNGINFCYETYDKQAGIALHGAQGELRPILQRFLFHYNWYISHQDSLHFELKRNTLIQQKINEMHPSDFMQLMENATQILCQCRETLIYTYVFVYYLEKNNRTAIFEAFQRDLQIATELLAYCIERELNCKNFAVLKPKILDQSRYCDDRRIALVKYVNQGYAEDLWIFTE